MIEFAFEKAFSLGLFLSYKGFLSLYAGVCIVSFYCQNVKYILWIGNY